MLGLRGLARVTGQLRYSRSQVFAQCIPSNRMVFEKPRVLFFSTEGDAEGEELVKKSKPKTKKYDYWKLGFIDMIRNPQSHKELFYYPRNAEDLEKHNVCVVYDRHPKAKKHFLVLPTTLLQKYEQLNETHIPLLEEMVDRAHQVVKEAKEADDGKDLNYKIGFQAIPNMLQIHLHVVSDDFVSSNMKNKRHWNTFNTDFFLSPDVIIDQLKEKGKVIIDEVHYNAIIKQPLACPKCNILIPRLPDLMVHLREFHNTKQ